MLVSTATKPSMISSLSLPQVIDFAVSSGFSFGIRLKKKKHIPSIISRHLVGHANNLPCIAVKKSKLNVIRT